MLYLRLEGYSMYMTVKQASEQGAYGNSRLLFRLRIYRYDKDNGGDDYGNKKDNS